MRTESCAKRPPLAAILSRRRRLIPLWFLLPSLAVFAVFAVWPMIEAIITSLSRYNLTEPGAQRTFIGFGNYQAMLANPTFWGDLSRSFLFVAVSVTASLLLGFYIAFLLFKATRGKGVFRIIFLMPMAVSPAITALAFKFMLNYEFGIINTLLEAFIGMKVNLLGDARTAIWATVAIDIWAWTPLVVLILLSGLESLSEEVFDAAAVDGAGAWGMLRYITLPLMKRFILIAILLRTMDAFRVYETIQLTTAGGPGNLSETLNVYIAKVGFSFFEMGPASAMAIILTIIVVAAGTIFVKWSRAFEEVD